MYVFNSWAQFIPINKSFPQKCWQLIWWVNLPLLNNIQVTKHFRSYHSTHFCRSLRIREFGTKLLNFPALRYNVPSSRAVNASSASGDEMLKILFVWFTTLLADSSESGGNGSKVEHVRWKAAVFAWRWIYSAPESCLREVD